MINTTDIKYQLESKNTKPILVLDGEYILLTFENGLQEYHKFKPLTDTSFKLGHKIFNYATFAKTMKAQRIDYRHVDLRSRTTAALRALEHPVLNTIKRPARADIKRLRAIRFLKRAMVKTYDYKIKVTQSPIAVLPPEVEDPKYYLIVKPFVIEDALYRVMAAKDLKYCKAGTIGGRVKGYYSLSQEGDCWVDYQSAILDNARVEGDIYITGPGGGATVRGNARINASGYTNLRTVITGNATINGHIEIRGSLIMIDNSKIDGFLKVQSNVYITMRDNAMISGTCLLPKTIRSGRVCINLSCSDLMHNQYSSHSSQKVNVKKHGYKAVAINIPDILRKIKNLNKD